MIAKLIVLLFSVRCLALNYTLENESEQCISVFANKNSYLSGFIKATEGQRSITGLVNGWIRDETGFKVWSKTGVSDEVHFAFKSASQPMSYKLCVQAAAPSAQESFRGPISIDVAQSFEISYDLFDAENARKLKIVPVEEDLARLQEKIALIGHSYQKIIGEEEKLEDSSDWTGSILSYCFFLVSGSLVSIAVWNLFFMMRFFKSKRLID